MASDSENERVKVEAVVQHAMQVGYQITPKAIALLVSLGSERERSRGAGPSLQMIVDQLLEKKSRSVLQNEGDVMASKEEYSITEDDVLKLLPEYFDAKGVGGEETSPESSTSEIEVVSNPKEVGEGQGKEGFLFLFRSRYEKIAKILRERPGPGQVGTISQINREKGVSRVCGLVLSKRVTKGGTELVIDDPTGRVSVLAPNDARDSGLAQVILDQCILVEAEAKNGRLLLKSVTQPDLPARVISTSKKVSYAIFLSDLHIGSNKFLEYAFEKFLSWLNGSDAAVRRSEHDQEILSHLNYIVIGGDIVDGVGVFPNQEYELVETDIASQYNMVAERLKKIPGRFAIIAIPGNHDSTRQALPQPSIPRKYSEALYKIRNLTMLGDPCVVKLRGVKTLVYHGRSLDDVLATTAGLSYERPTEPMKVLLRARHLAPMFGSRTPIAPELEDQLVIDTPPDIFHAGHVHTLGVESYKGTLVINSGTWQAQTSYQSNLGIMPSPGIVPIVNLATFEVTLKQFLTTED